MLLLSLAYRSIFDLQIFDNVAEWLCFMFLGLISLLVRFISAGVWELRHEKIFSD